MNYLQMKDFEQYTDHAPQAIVDQYEQSLLKRDGETLLDAVNRYGLEKVITYLSDVLDTQIRVSKQ